MNAIVAADRNWAIGKDGDMLYSLPLDLKYFAGITKGKVLVLGRKTLESFPGSRPLPKRHHIVLSRDASYAPPGVQVVHSIPQLAQAIASYPPDEVMLLGGDSIYHLLIDCCLQAYVTKVDAQAPADSFFPNLDEKPNWRLISCEEPIVDNGTSIRFCVYQNSQVTPLADIKG